MGNTHVKPHPRSRNKKQVHWKAADRPSPPGKPQLISETEVTPDLITIRWSKPLSDGGSPIAGYLVEHRRTGSPHWVRATPLMVQLPELTISGLEPGWRYQFRISAENNVGLSDPSECSEPITVTLQRSAITAPRFTQELKDAVALENDKVEFVVHFLGQPAPKVCWFKDGFEIFSSRRIRIITEHDKSIMTIHQSALYDEGEIKCTATNKAGHVSSKAKLAIEAPPSIRLPRQYEEGLLFEIGEMIRLKVSVAGRPIPLIFWTHDGETIQNNDRYEVEYSDKSSTLKIGEAVRSDRGEYQIKAVNKLGDDVAAFLVTVTDKPSPPGRARVVMTLGKSVTLSWGLPNDDGGCKIGNYIIEYYRLGWNVWLKAATTRQLSTILGDLIEGSEYKFRIKAESPYGVSEPSEESETVFIPDPKRGITQPSEARSRSQSRDIISDLSTPVAAKRKNKPRSQSSSRAEETSWTANMNADISNAGIPKRPERSKAKSPSQTPEMTPLMKRKEADKYNMNHSVYDRASMARELAYGSPEIKVKKELDLPISNSSYSSGSDRSIASSSNQKQQANEYERGNDFTGSSEFMLVLYPDEKTKDHSSDNQKIVFDFDEYSIPPPLSLSAPELGAEPPDLLYNLKQSASSTELLHERAMARFYQAAEAEERELEKRRKLVESRKQSVDVPKIQINSQDNQEIVGLERKHSLRRRLSAGGISQQQILWTQRRQSLKSANEVAMLENKLQKHPLTVEQRRELMMLRQRSESEEKEEEEFAKVRSRMSGQKQASREKRRKISVVDEEKWNEDYVEEEESDASSEEDKRRFEDILQSKSVYGEEEEDEIYHPGRMPNAEDPFEILTVRKDLPDPNFIPKPILKKTDHEEFISPLEIAPKKKPTRQGSPIRTNLFNRERSHSTTGQEVPSPFMSKFSISKIKKEATRPRSFSLIPQQEISEQSEIEEQLESLKELRKQTVSPLHHISAIAGISGIAAASIVIPKALLDRKKDAEEAKVVIDHYGDIVKTVTQQRKRSIPELYLDKDTLKEVTKKQELDEAKAPPPPKPITVEAKPIRERKLSFSDEVAQTSKPTEPIRDKVPIKRSRRTPSQSPSCRSKRQPSKSPARPEIRNSYHRSPARQSSPRKSKSPSPLPQAGRRPKLREIMTQTSVGLESFSNDSFSRTSTPTQKQEELIAQAEVKVRSIIDYVTDLTMFLVACWMYFFNNELYAVPILFVMVYRQLRAEVGRRIPNWVLKRLKRDKKKD